MSRKHFTCVFDRRHFLGYFWQACAQEVCQHNITKNVAYLALLVRVALQKYFFSVDGLHRLVTRDRIILNY